MATHLSRKQKELKKAKEVVNLQEEPSFDKEDKANMAEQCYHYNEAVNIGTVTSTMAKYAIFYRNRWFFGVYNRDENKISSMLTMDQLDDREMVTFMQYKNRLENDKRIQRLNTIEK